MNPVKQYLDASTDAEQTELAKRGRTTRGQLRQLAGRHRKASADLAIRLERASKVMQAKNPRLPFIKREQLAKACRSCEFAKRCR